MLIELEYIINYLQLEIIIDIFLSYMEEKYHKYTTLNCNYRS